MLIELLAAERPSPADLNRLTHHYELKDDLDGEWAARPLELVSGHGRTMLELEDPGGEPLARLIDAPMEPGRFLHLAITIAAAVGKTHRRGLLHKDLKPAHILVNCAGGGARLTASASPPGFLANVSLLSRSKRSRARSPIWRRNRPDG